ncbi:DUF5706 domain-containing protein [Pontibacter sp. E15-1]|uniref:Pycsar system effector family protein n=1 Tax=Pontibacter sp. E15-1 TaxID=2919918 RepID=UPI001F4FFAFA|nr:Pycsar system effector family protein [Pontibacter sp. E15-1]MCJ8165030.1 DUF5706 domain-containing protein [Pontibacter sp. E15-1]
MITETAILDQAQTFAMQQFSRDASPETAHYNLPHTQQLVSRTQEIGEACGLAEAELKRVLLAAWLHDLSYLEPQEPNAPNTSRAFLQAISPDGTTDPEIEKVLHCLAASRYPQQPQDAAEEVFCDAVASFLASQDYLLQAVKDTKATPAKSAEVYAELKRLRVLLQKHDYFTRYAKRVFSGGKEDTRKKLKKLSQEFSEDNAELQALWEENKQLRKDLGKEREQKVSKGIETMFRTTITNHIQLSVMADSKANLMISINAIITSIMISSFVRKFDEVPHLIGPSILLTLVCVLTIVFAVLSTRPNIKTKVAPKGRLDYLFFGDFVHLTADDYRTELRGIMHNHERLYDSMIDNIFVQGKVLARKYKLLKIAYTIFMVGFAVVLLSYAIAWLFFAPEV